MKTSIIILLVLAICSGCSTPSRLGKRDVRDISSLSTAVNATITVDVAGFTDSIDVPISQHLAEKLQETIAQTLSVKGYHLMNHNLSVGMAHSHAKYYVIATDNDRKRDPTQLEARPGPYFSEWLDPQQLKILYQDIAAKDDIPALGHLGFDGDATLVILVQGRLIGADKVVGSYLANAAIITLTILSGGGSYGGSPELVDTDDTYRVQLRLYSTHTGDILWQRDFKAHSVTEVLQQTNNNLQERLPDKR